MCAVGDWYAGLHEPHLPKSHPGSIWGDHEKGLLSLAAVGGGGGGGWAVWWRGEGGGWEVTYKPYPQKHVSTMHDYTGNTAVKVFPYMEMRLRLE